MTEEENRLWYDFLRELPVQVRRQKQFGDYIVDFVSQREGLVIEVDGGYHAERQQKEDDEARERDLEQMGFHVMRFTNEEVLYDTDYVLSQIEAYFK